MDNKVILALLFFGILLINGCAKIGDLQDNKQKTNAKCGIESCHGLDIKCGENVPEVCTELYQLGDFCRQYAECGIVNGNCQLIESKKFNTCKECIEKCSKLEVTESFDCESGCRTLFE